MPKLRAGSTVLTCLGMGLSVLALSVIQPPCHWHILAWIAWVPFILASVTASDYKRLIVISWGFSVAYWLFNLHWIGPITPPGWIALSVFLSLGWPVTAVIFRFCCLKKIALWLICPFVIVGTEMMQGRPISPFYWRFLAHSQFTNLPLIQIADLLGAGGVSFLIALINGTIAQGILSLRLKPIPFKSVVTACVISVLALASTLGYGYQQLRLYDAANTDGPLVASVQSNVPQSVKDSLEASDEIFEDLLALSKEAANTHPELIVWPETMVQAIINKEIIPYLAHQEDSTAFDTALEQHAKEARTHLLVGTYGGSLTRDDQGQLALNTHNSAMLYFNNGTQALRRYDKIRLILFGEYMPFKQSWPWLYNQLMRCTPYDYDYSMTPGQTYSVFTLINQANTDQYRFATLICYEDTIPNFVRQFVLSPEDHHKQIHWLVNISNDGWFARMKDGQVQSTSELIQHVSTAAFRAVENRVCVLRSVNTGISCLIDPCGRLKQGFDQASQNFPQRVQDRQGVAGWFSDKMPIYEKVSVFSRIGPWLDHVCAWIYCLTGLSALFSMVRIHYVQKKMDLS